jgi:hypothetical protein
MKYITFGQNLWYGFLVWILLVIVSELVGIDGNTMIPVGVFLQSVINLWWLWSWYMYEESDCNDKFFRIKDLVS